MLLLVAILFFALAVLLLSNFLEAMTAQVGVEWMVAVLGVEWFEEG